MAKSEPMMHNNPIGNRKRKKAAATATTGQGNVALRNIFFANLCVKKVSQSDRITRFFALTFIKKYCFQGAKQF